MTFKWLFAICMLLYVIYYSFNDEVPVNPTVETHGFTYWKTHTELHEMSPVQKRIAIAPEVLSKLPDGYVLMDYYYYIKGCSLSTFHRDVTSGQKYFQTHYPTYTVIMYEYAGDFLSICPHSHQQFPFVWQRPVVVSGETNTIVIFNADMLHCGTINQVGDKRKVLQFKVVHSDDYERLTALDNIRLEKKEDCGKVSYASEFAMRLLSFHFAWLFNSVCYPLMQRKLPGGVGGLLQNLVPISFYNNQAPNTSAKVSDAS